MERVQKIVKAAKDGERSDEAFSERWKGSWRPK